MIQEHFDGLNSSQRKAAEEIKAHARDGWQSPVELIGLSGAGKSHLVRAIGDATRRKIVTVYSEFDKPLIEPGNLYEVDGDLVGFCGSLSKSSDILRDLTLAKVRTVIYRNPARAKNATEKSNPATKETDLKTVELKSMTDEEIVAMAKAFDPRIDEYSLDIIKKYSLGIPLLVRRILDQPSLLEEDASKILRRYLDKSFRSIRENRRKTPEQIDQIIHRFTGRELPKEIRDDLSAAETSPLKSIAPRCVELPIPEAPETSRIYKELSRFRGYLGIEIFTDGVTARDIIETLGFSSRGDVNEGRIKDFGGSSRKTSANQVGMLVGSESYYGSYYGGCEHPNSELISAAIERYRKVYPEQATERSKFTTPTIFETHDHEGLIENQILVGYAIETLLQGRGIQYIVMYKKDRKNEDYLYDPERKQMTKVKV